jgi:hypothetical protein
MGTFAEVDDMTDLQKADMLGYIGYVSQTGEMVQESLGWDKPAVKSKSKKTK